MGAHITRPNLKNTGKNGGKISKTKKGVHQVNRQPAQVRKKRGKHQRAHQPPPIGTFKSRLQKPRETNNLKSPKVKKPIPNPKLKKIWEIIKKK